MTRYNKMERFDVTGMDSVDPRLAALLGYRKMYSKKELPMTGNLDYNERCIFVGNEQGTLGRALRKNNVEGIMISDNELIRQTIEECKDHEKILFISTAGLILQDQRQRLRNIYRTRFLMGFAMRSRARIALISAADDESGMLSVEQMILTARFLGADEKRAAAMVSSIGWFFDT